jgi:hypothetical protein
MKKMTLTNDFHNTEVTILVPTHITDMYEAWEWMEEKTQGYPPYDYKLERKFKRVKRALCGVDGCCCGVIRCRQ